MARVRISAAGILDPALTGAPPRPRGARHRALVHSRAASATEQRDSTLVSFADNVLH
jgi:hypothetical protein